MTFRRIALALLLLTTVLGVGVYIWARAVLSEDSVRLAVAAQLSKALGQPVTVGRVGLTILPRVTLDLSDVSVGLPPRITVKRLQLGTDFRALLSRRIEHGSARLTGARIELPLPVLALGSPAPAGAAPARPVVDIVSIDSIALADVEVVHGARTLRADAEFVPSGRGAIVRRLTLRANDIVLDATGHITDLAGPSGDLTITASGLDILDLVAFAQDFSRGVTMPAAEGSATARAPAASVSDSAPAAAMNLTLAISADRALVGTLQLNALSARAQVHADAVTLEPIHFGAFGGTFDGRLTLSLAASNDFHIKGALASIDMAAVTAFAGRGDSITGRLASTIDVSGRVTSTAALLGTTRGNARMDITNGTIKNLGLVRKVVLAGSMRASSQAIGRTEEARESFTRLGLTIAIAQGVARTSDLRFESPDVLLTGIGSLRLDGRAIELAGPLQLSDALSKQAGQDLLRYTAKDGRVTVPVTLTGAVDDLHVGIDAGEVAKRAITNRAKEEILKALIKIIKR